MVPAQSILSLPSLSGIRLLLCVRLCVCLRVWVHVCERECVLRALNTCERERLCAGTPPLLFARLFACVSMCVRERVCAEPPPLQFVRLRVCLHAWICVCARLECATTPQLCMFACVNTCDPPILRARSLTLCLLVRVCMRLCCVLCVFSKHNKKNGYLGDLLFSYISTPATAHTTDTTHTTKKLLPHTLC